MVNFSFQCKLCAKIFTLFFPRPCTGSNLQTIVPLTKISVIDFFHLTMTNFDIGNLQLHEGIEEIRLSNGTPLFLDGSYLYVFST